MVIQLSLTNIPVNFFVVVALSQNIEFSRVGASYFSDRSYTLSAVLHSNTLASLSLSLSLSFSFAKQQQNQEGKQCAIFAVAVLV